MPRINPAIAILDEQIENVRRTLTDFQNRAEVAKDLVKQLTAIRAEAAAAVRKRGKSKIAPVTPTPTTTL